MFCVLQRIQSFSSRELNFRAFYFVVFKQDIQQLFAVTTHIRNVRLIQIEPSDLQIYGN